MVDILAYARFACYSIFTGTTYTAAQQIAWATAMLTGPMTPRAWTLLITEGQRLDRCGSEPTTTSAWVSPVDGSFCARQRRARRLPAFGRWNAAIGDLTTFNPGNRAWIEDIA